jgi:hypothetical protein
MWGSALFDDDSLNAKLADEYGIVIGTFIMNADARRTMSAKNGSGPWNYEKN